MTSIVNGCVGHGRRQEDRGSGLTGEMEGRRKITGDRSPPWCEVHLGKTAQTEASLNEAYQRCMVKQLRVDPSACAPGRDHEHRHPYSEAIGSGRKLRISREYLIGNGHGGET